MATRREVIQGAAAATAATIIPTRILAGSFTGGSAMIERYFYDSRNEAGRRFAQELAMKGVTAAGAGEDWTALWLREIDPTWRNRPMPIAGVTLHGPMFMLSQIAQRHGMRLAYQAEIIERPTGAGMRVQGLRNLVDSTGLRAVPAAVTPENFAAAFLGLNGQEIARSTRVNYTSGLPATPDEDPYYAWIIAPVAGAARYT